MTREIGYKTKPIDQAFLSKPDEFPITGEHNGHKVRAAGVQRIDGDGKPLPTAHGIHGTNTAVDWDACSADGVCMDVCPVFVYEWALNTGQSGSGKDMVLAPGTPEYDSWRSDKSEPMREKDCIYCMACETSCPTQCIKITQP